jgi:glycosyltransferase involved in cell wall biosynthesis
MRVLLVSAMTPYLPSHDGFRLVPANLINHLHARHEFHLIAVSSGAESREQLDWSRRVCKSASFYRSTRRISAKFRALTGAADPVLERAVARAIRELEPGVIHVEGGELASLLRNKPRSLRGVLCVHDSKSLRYREFARWSDNAAARARMSLLSALARLHERRWFRFADRVVVTSKADADALAPSVDACLVTVIPNGVDLQYFAFHPKPQAGRIVFTGNMSWPPNEDAAEHFARAILPSVRACATGTSFWIVGADPSARVRALAELPGVHLTGTVEDMRPWIQSAAVYVSPLRFGMGVKNKILEAMASGAPIVATSRSLSGTPLVHGRHAMIADDDVAISDAVLRLLGDEALRRSLSAAAREKVEREHSWETVAGRYERLYLNGHEEGSG